ncbi:hypothetical protein [Agromyces sp. ZXT2-6]|uniref:hypothetical protein n=1 Tax=Agromyces sp. ZXT2-6 TaxID=3461153 RepID=UPI004054B550
MRRFTKTAAITFAGALALTGCSGQTGDELLAGVESQELADAVEDFAEEVRDSAEYTAGLSDPGAANEDELAERREELQDAVAEIEEACTPDE